MLSMKSAAALAAATANESAANEFVQQARSRLAQADANHQYAQTGSQQVSSTRARVRAAIADLPRKQRETRILQEHPAIFIIGIGWPLKEGYPHEMRAADYDDWVTDTHDQTGKDTHGLNGDILVWNHVTHRRHELSSMGIRVTAETLKKQLQLSNQNDFLKLPYHQAILNNQIPLSIGGGIGQSRTLMLLLRKAHLGEVSVTVWPKILKEMCARKNIFVLD